MKRLFNLVFIMLIPVNLTAQLTPATDQYILNPLTINPAYAGARGALNIATFYRRQWIGVAGAPETMILAMDAPFLDSKLGLGLIVTNDKFGVTKETQFCTNYAYRINAGDKNFSFGLGASLMTTNTAWSDLVVLDPGDEHFLVDSRVFIVPDFSFGIYFSDKNYFFGMSVPKLMVYKFDFNKNKYSLGVDMVENNYLFNTGYIFNLSPKVKIFPSTLVTYTIGKKLQYDLNAYLSLFNRMWFGTSYRNNRSVAAMLQVAVNDQLRIAYTYNFDFNRLGKYNNGSHEIMLRYEFRYRVNVINPLKF